MARQVAEELTVQPEALGSASEAAVNNSTQAVGIATTRLASLRTGRQYAGGVGSGSYGFSAGDASVEKAVWFKPFGNVIDKRSDDGIPGYLSQTGGVVVGWERRVGKSINTGVAAAYAETEVDGAGAGGVRLETDHYQALLYGDYTRRDFYLESNVSVGRNRSETRRTLASVGAGTAEGSFDGWQYNATVKMGWPRAWKDNTFFTPIGGVSWTEVNTGSYTETGATSSGLNLIVTPDDVTTLVGTLGARLHNEYTPAGGGQIVPSFTVGVNYDFAGDEATATAQYTGGGAAFTTSGAEIKPLGVNAGLGLHYDTGGRWIFRANYDLDIKSGQTGHSGSLEWRFKF